MQGKSRSPIACSIHYILAAVVICLFLFSCYDKKDENPPVQSRRTVLVDDCGEEIPVPKPYNRIISLYPAHTENLFSLGLDRQIIGVYRGDDYPPRVKDKPHYDYRRDPEEVIAAAPDLVLIRPFIKRGYEDFVKTLENNGIMVAAFYPEQVADFDKYIISLGQLTGRTGAAEKLIQLFHQELSRMTDTRKPGKTCSVFFEATEHLYRTVIDGSFPAFALDSLGLHRIGSGTLPMREGSSLASFGLERLLEHAGEIDLYIAQRGSMNPGITVGEVKKRNLFQGIKAVQEDHVCVIDEALISRPTMRYIEGVKQISRFLAGSVLSDPREEDINSAIR
jgi:iron complex transport system substrate-binding protein